MDNKISKSRDELKEDYKYLTSGSGLDKVVFSTNCLRFLEENRVSDCFKLLPLVDIKNSFLKKALEKAELREKRTKEAEIKHLVKIFQTFEQYAANILANPWCRELHKIKLYTGFFKYNFEQWLSLDLVFSVFKSIGYEKISFDTLKLRIPIDYERVSVMGFEMYLAHYQLYILQSTQLLTCEYAMEDIIEGWLNTTGNIVNIREWLGKNKFGAESANQIASSPSADIPEKTRLDSFTIGFQSSFDRNGYPIKNSVKYPTGSQFSGQDLQMPNRSWQNKQRELEGGLSSLPALNISDCNLYGEDDYVALEDPGKKTSESDLRARNSDCERMENKYLGNMPDEQGYNTASHRNQPVVARGGPIPVGVHEKERVGEILERRNKRHFEEMLSRETASSNYHGGVVDKQPTQKPMIADTTLDATMRFRVTCAICYNAPPAMYCIKCRSKVCNGCYNTLLHHPCVSGTKHELHEASYISSV